MNAQKRLMVALSAIIVLFGHTVANPCSCHTCPSGSYSIPASNQIFEVGGSDSFDGGIVDGAAFTIDNVIWLEAGLNNFNPSEPGAGFYSDGETRSGHEYAGGSFIFGTVEISLPVAVSNAISAGCFCPNGGMDLFTAPQTVGGASRTWIDGSPTPASCHPSTSNSSFSITYNSGSNSVDSFGNYLSATPGIGFSNGNNGVISFGGQLALFGTVCGACPTPMPTSAPTQSPTVEPTSQPTESPIPNPTNQPTQSPTSGPTGSPTDMEDPTFFEEERNVYIVSGAGGGLLLLLIMLGLARARRNSAGKSTLVNLPDDIEQSKNRKIRGNAPDPKTSQSIRLEIDDEIFDWEKHIDKSSGEVYFFNPKTGESRWDPPTIKKKT